MTDLEQQHPEIMPGGRWSPPNCQSRHRMALVIPYRDRIQHLRTFLHNIHPFLQKQQLDYGIFVVEQVRDALWLFDDYELVFILSLAHPKTHSLMK
jgi:hypothetical protein